MNKRLYRSRKDTFLSGVCGGIADYFNFDVSLVRIGWVVATLATGGLGLIAYIIAAVVVPMEPVGGMSDMNTEQHTEKTTASEPKSASYTNVPPYSNDSDSWRRDSGSTRKYGGLFLILLGVFFIIRRYIPSIDFGMLWAVCLVLVGIGLMTRRG